MTRTPSSSDSAPGDHGRRGLAERVSDDRARAHPVGLHRRGQRDLHGEQGRLHPVDTGHGLRRRHRLGHREAGLLGDQRLEVGDGCGENRFVGQQVGAHGRPLRTLPGEHPHRSAVVVAHSGLIRELTVGDLAQSFDQLGESFGDHRGTHRPVRAPAGKGVGQIRQRHGSCAALRTQSASRPAVSAQRVGGGGRQREQQRGR